MDVIVLVFNDGMTFTGYLDPRGNKYPKWHFLDKGNSGCGLSIFSVDKIINMSSPSVFAFRIPINTLHPLRLQKTFVLFLSF